MIQTITKMLGWYSACLVLLGLGVQIGLLILNRPDPLVHYIAIGLFAPVAFYLLRQLVA